MDAAFTGIHYFSMCFVTSNIYSHFSLLTSIVYLHFNKDNLHHYCVHMQVIRSQMSAKFHWGALNSGRFENSTHPLPKKNVYRYGTHYWMT